MQKRPGTVFLTAEDLCSLTGYRKPALQRRWLFQNGYRFAVRADGRPAVLRSAIEASLTGRTRAMPVEPDFSVLE